ncbi:patatin-like phospholipase family protein [Psychrobacter submarinus]|uniref:patatin-like phospholipase family protein n=1 Tax=Psychrobacter submarinus TaxID=154108 RepID=UPI001919AFB9|nr:patatin-like phospholipase family protein [Psychrobacter submarinus]
MNNDSLLESKPYQRVQLFSGGGYRFGYYLGSYAALCEYGLKPDLILATCGGSLASLLVNIAPDPEDLKLLIESKALYNVVKSSQHRQDFTLSAKQQKPSYFYQGLKRLGLSTSASRTLKLHQRETYDELLAELHNFAMFEIADETTWLDELIQLQPSLDMNASPDTAIIASRLVPTEDSLKQTPQAKNLQLAAKLQEVLFTPAHLRACIDKQTLACPTHRYAPLRIKKQIHLVTDCDIAQAVRASMADMYYLQPTFIEGLGWSLGGVIDLTPIELAAQFGNSVFAETKAGYDKVLAAPAIQRIFGFDPNERLAEVLSFKTDKNSTNDIKQNNIHWLPFADNGKALAGQHVRKRLNIRQGRIDLIHADYDDFVQQMQAQWHYGYQRTLKYLQANDLA